MPDCLTISPECHVVCLPDGPYGLVAHVMRWHPHSTMADAIRRELNVRVLDAVREER
jgi:hypothetical protein